LIKCEVVFSSNKSKRGIREIESLERLLIWILACV